MTKSNLHNRKITELPYKNLRTSIAAYILVVLVFFLLFKGETDPAVMAGWLGGNIIIILFRILIYSLFTHHRRFHLREIRRKDLFFNLSLTGSGLLLGSAALFIYTDSIELHFFMLLFLGGMTAGAVGSYSASLSSYLFYSLPVMSPVTVRLLISGTPLKQVPAF